MISPEREVAPFLQLTRLAAHRERAHAARYSTRPGTRFYFSSQRAFGPGAIYEVTGPFRQERPPERFPPEPARERAGVDRRSQRCPGAACPSRCASSRAVELSLALRTQRLPAGPPRRAQRPGGRPPARPRQPERAGCSAAATSCCCGRASAAGAACARCARGKVELVGGRRRRAPATAGGSARRSGLTRPAAAAPAPLAVSPTPPARGGSARPRRAGGRGSRPAARG